MSGLFTGILGVTLWNIFFNGYWPIRRALVIVIIVLYALVTISVAANWAYVHSAFIDNGQSFWTVYLKLATGGQATYWEMDVSAWLSTILTDSYAIWCCWMVWGRRWLVVLPPILSLVCTIRYGSKIVVIYYNNSNASGFMNKFIMLYTSSILVTTLSCTSLIIYRILTVAGVRRGAEGRLRVFYHSIEVMVESSALYSVSLILYLAFTIRHTQGEVYLDAIAGIAKGIAPTLLVGRIAIGRRARPDDSWQGSVIASVSITSQEQGHNQTRSQEDRLTNLVLDDDLEAQHGESGGEEPSSAFFSRPGAQSQGAATLPKSEDFPLYHLGDTEGSNRVSVESLRLGPH
ncbi:hypothetical protein F5146DRAFT_507403 [Armillaria mellea]|nr:hypothetical protein F5146DRAFT_507403 [Armillaria mellea]